MNSYLNKQGVIQEFAVKTVKHKLGISNNSAEGVQSFPLYMAFTCSENDVKVTFATKW